jgi:hypothetical protein
MGRVNGEDLADNHPVEQHADCRQMQFDGWLGGGRLQHLYIGGDMNRLDLGERADLVPLEPREKMARGPIIGHTGVLIADRRGEKFDEPARCVFTGIGDHRRHDDVAAR